MLPSTITLEVGGSSRQRPLGPFGRAGRPTVARWRAGIVCAMLATARPGVASRLRAAAALVVLAAGWWGFATPAGAATTHRVDVVGDDDGAFDPPEVTVTAGDSVRWVWVVADSRSITFDDAEKSGGCARPISGCEGHEHVATFPDPGTYAYTDTVGGGFTGTVVVEAPASPSPTASPTPTRPAPSDDPTSEPEPSPSPPSPEPSPTGTTPPPPPAPSPTPAPEPTTDQAEPSPLETASPSPSPTTDDPTEAPTSSPRPVPSPTFEDFPAAREPEVDDVEGSVAVDGGGGGGQERVVWGVVGGATLLGTIGAFGRRVLFGDPWDG